MTYGLISLISLPIGYDIFSPIVLDIQIWVSFGPILEWRQEEELGMGHNITVSKTGLKNEMITPEKHSYWIWSFYHSWNIVYKFGPFLAQFWLYDVTSIVKFQIFPKIKYFPSKNIYDSKFKTLYCYLAVIYSFETPLKNFGKWH